MTVTETTAPCKITDELPSNHDKDCCDKGDGSGVNAQKIASDGNNPNDATGGSHEAHISKKGKQSFASLFKDNRAPVQESLLKFIEPPIGEVIIDSEEIETVEKTFGFCLVGYVMGPRPSAFAMLNFVKRWDSNVKFLFKENGWIKFQFTNELQRDAVLMGGPYLISGRQLFLKKMPSCFLYSKEDMMFLPSWIQIFGLPADCWTAPALSKIASVVGKPIHTDQLTITKKGSTYARVLVEIDATKPRIWECPVKLPTGKVTVVKYKYEMDPKFCDKCKTLGHTTEFCGVEFKKRSASQQKKQTDVYNDPTTKVAVEQEADILKMASTIPRDTPECSHNQDSMVSEKASCTQQPTPCANATKDMDRTTGKRKVGKGDDFPPQNRGKQTMDDFGDDDLLSCEDTDSYTYRMDDFVSNGDESDDILSPIQAKDRDEWKTVSKKKNRRYNQNVKVVSHKAHQGGGNSSMETEYVPIDPSSNKPMNGGKARVFGKSKSEARRPYTAFGGQ